MRRDNFIFTFTLYLAYIIEVQFSKFDQDTVKAMGLTRPAQQKLHEDRQFIWYFTNPLIGLIPILLSESKNFVIWNYFRPWYQDSNTFATPDSPK